MLSTSKNGVTKAKTLNEEVLLRKSIKSLFTIPATIHAVTAACGLMFSLVTNKLLPMELLAMGNMIIKIFNWGPNIVVSSTFLSMMKGIAPSGTLGFYAVLCFLGWVFVFFRFPEAANMTLEEVWVVFKHGFGVRYVEEWRKQQRANVKWKRVAEEACGSD
jgi:hypothetical protein